MLVREHILGRNDFMIKLCFIELYFLRCKNKIYDDGLKIYDDGLKIACNCSIVRLLSFQGCFALHLPCFALHLLFFKNTFCVATQITAFPPALFGWYFCVFGWFSCRSAFVEPVVIFKLFGH